MVSFLLRQHGAGVEPNDEALEDFGIFGGEVHDLGAVARCDGDI